MRTFVAINFPDDLKNSIRSIQNKLQPYVKTARWTRRENLHLTLKFLGEIDDGEKESAVKAIQKACKGSQPFEMVLDKLGYFGSAENMRVMWMGTSHADSLLSLQRSVEESFAEFGFLPDNKGFKPHITIGRNVMIDQNIDLSSIMKPDKLYVDNVYLMLSENKGKGYFYTPIYKIDL